MACIMCSLLLTPCNLPSSDHIPKPIHVFSEMRQQLFLRRQCFSEMDCMMSQNGINAPLPRELQSTATPTRQSRSLLPLRKRRAQRTTISRLRRTQAPHKHARHDNTCNSDASSQRGRFSHDKHLHKAQEALGPVMQLHLRATRQNCAP